MGAGGPRSAAYLRKPSLAPTLGAPLFLSPPASASVPPAAPGCTLPSLLPRSLRRPPSLFMRLHLRPRLPHLRPSLPPLHCPHRPARRQPRERWRLRPSPPPSSWRRWPRDPPAKGRPRSPPASHAPPSPGTCAAAGRTTRACAPRSPSPPTCSLGTRPPQLIRL